MSTLGFVVFVALVLACGDDKNLELTEAVETATAEDPGGPPTGDTGSTVTSGSSSGDGGSSGDPSHFTGETGSTGEPFIHPSDGGAAGECSVWTQDCSEGQKCSAYADDGGSSWNANKCVPVMPDPHAPGEACTVTGSGVSGIDDCELGSMCWDVGDDLMGTCVALCTGSLEEPMCLDPATACVIYNDGVLNLCLDRCDPLVVDCPDPDALCLPNRLEQPDGFICVLDASGDGGQVHTPCSYANACDKGLHCADPSAASECDPRAAGCCEPFCDLTLPDPDSQCPGAGQQCVALFMPDMAPMGDEDVGVCAVPP